MPSLGLTDWTYTRREVDADELAGVVAGLDASWRGLSLTMPLKEAALDVAATVSDVARERGRGQHPRAPDGRRAGTGTTPTSPASPERCAERRREPARRPGHAAGLGRHEPFGRAGARRPGGARGPSSRARNTEAAAAVVALLESHGVAAGHVPLEHWVREPGQLVVSTLPPSASTRRRRGSLDARPAAPTSAA